MPQFESGSEYYFKENIMFVIKHGNAFIQRECPKCSCVFAFDYSDICEEWHKEDDDDDYVGFAYVCCPECGRQISWPIRKPDDIDEWRSTH